MKNPAASSGVSDRLGQTIAAGCGELTPERLKQGREEGEHWQTIIKGIGAVSKSRHYVNLSMDEHSAHH
jgi:hypothetical protein